MLDHFGRKKEQLKAGVRINANECSTKIKYTRKQRTTILYIFFIHAPKVKEKESKSDFKHTENVFSECVKTALQCQSVTRGAVKYYIKAPAPDTILNIWNWSKCKGYRIALVWKSQIQLWRVWLPPDNSSHVSLQLISTKHRSDIGLKKAQVRERKCWWSQTGRDRSRQQGFSGIWDWNHFTSVLRCSFLA